MKNTLAPGCRKDTRNDEAEYGQAELTMLFKQWRRRIGHYSMLAVFPALIASNSHNARAEERSTTEPSNPDQASARSRGRAIPRSQFARTQANSIIVPTAGNDECPGKAIPPGTYTAATPYTDSGNTTGANNTVGTLYNYYYGYSHFNAAGPDQVYTFTISSFGENPRIEVTPANPSSYKPLIYLAPAWVGCPSGTGNDLGWSYSTDDARLTGSWGDGIIGVNGRSGQRLVLFIDSQVNDALGSGAYTLKLQDMTIAYPEWGGFDFDGGGGSHSAIFRPSEPRWRFEFSPPIQFGLATDTIVPADYDNDGKTDVAIFRDGQWWWINSSNSTVSVVQFGLPGDIPVPADYTGDGRDELAIYRNGTWWSVDITNSQVSVVQFGLQSDKPVPADYDGDGKKDRAIYRNGVWWILKSNGQFYVQQWGLASDRPVPADYDGDGKTDQAIFRNGDWYILRSSGGIDIRHWGLSSDIPVPARYPIASDYPPDGKAQPAVFRDGFYYILRSNGGFESIAAGEVGDIPVQAAYLR